MKATVGYFPNLTTFPNFMHGYALGYGNIAVRYDSDNTVAFHREKFLQDLGGKWEAFAALSPSLNGYLQYASEKKDIVTEAEGLMTIQKNLLLTLPLADCRGSVIYCKAKGEKDGVALLHGSWRSISRQYPLQAMQQLQKRGYEPKDMFVGVTPGICEKHLVLNYLDQNALQQAGWEKASAITHHADGWHLDTKKYLLWQYQEAGILLDHMVVAKECTYEIMEQADQQNVTPPLYSHKYAITHPGVKQQRFWVVAGLQ